MQANRALSQNGTRRFALTVSVDAVAGGRASLVIDPTLSAPGRSGG
ncbi:hypothetical protein GCM10023351_25420 [Microbacterium gilvum]|uniref:Uncharacterized protein n=1 Tax=Microbacterium gilvum TaxID=1336204 RepID=A0ABP9AEI5_9MICO